VRACQHTTIKCIEERDNSTVVLQSNTKKYGSILYRLLKSESYDGPIDPCFHRQFLLFEPNQHTQVLAKYLALVDGAVEYIKEGKQTWLVPCCAVLNCIVVVMKQSVARQESAHERTIDGP
jgi:hypothetical protein